MRLNNGNKVRYFNFLSTLLIMLSVFGMIFFLLEIYVYDYLDEAVYLFLAIPFALVGLFYIRGRQIFEYDSDGEALNIRNRNIFPFINKTLYDEFPKYKVLSYDVANFFLFKKLYITISSKKNNTVTLKYDTSYLTKKELNDLKFSLSKVIKNNKK
jgi:hypothetical protein